MSDIKKTIVSKLILSVIVVSFLYLVITLGESVAKIIVFLTFTLLILTVTSESLLIRFFKRNEDFYIKTRIVGGLVFVPIWVWFFSHYNFKLALVSGIAILVGIVEDLVKILRSKK